MPNHQQEFIQKIHSFILLTQNVISKDEEIGIKIKQNQNKKKHLQFQTKLNENNKNETNNLKNIQLVSAPRDQTRRNKELIKDLTFV